MDHDVFHYTAGEKILTFDPGFDLRMYVEGEALLLFFYDPSAGDRVTPQQTVTITAVDTIDRTLTVAEPLISGLNGAKWMYKSHKLVTGGVSAGAKELLVVGSMAYLFPKDSWAFVTDGVGVLELYGEYVRIVGAVPSGNDTLLTLETGVRQSYISNRAAMIPHGRWIEDVTIRNLTLGGQHDYGHESANLTAKFCVNLRLEGVQSEVAVEGQIDSGTLISTSQGVKVSDGRFTQGKGFLFGATRDALVENSRVWVDNEEFCSDIVYRDCDIISYFRQSIGTHRVRAESCRLWNISEFHLGDDCGLYNCDIIAPVNDFYVVAQRSTFDNVRCVAGNWRIWIQTGADHFINNFRGNLRLDVNSTGTIVGPVYGTITGYYTNVDGPPPASWTFLSERNLRYALPTSLNETVVLGKLTGGRSAIWARIAIAIVGYGISVARQYFICRGWTDTNEWYTCIPSYDGKQPNTTDDFELELREEYENCWLRVRRSAGTAEAELSVRIETNAIFMSDAPNPPSGSAIGNHQSTAATQKRGMFYVTSPVIVRTEAPDDANLAAGQCALWFDGTSTPKLMIRAQMSGGGYVSGSVALS